MSRTRLKPWLVVVVVEDDTDGRALRKLAEASGLPVRVDWLPAHGIGNLKRKSAKLIRLAADRIESGRGCVAVVVDRDGRDSRRHEPHRTIARICRASQVPYVEAVEAFEAWYLADEGILEWLGLKSQADVDRIGDPKRVVAEAFYRKTKRTYQRRRARVQLPGKATGIEPDRAPSWRRALEHLERCPAGESAG